MSANKFGEYFSFMTFGESHGAYIGVVIDGVKPGLSIDASELQKELNRRRPGQSSVTTPRNESDAAQIVSGIFEGKTTGTPVCILIKNEDQRSKDYGAIAEILRPGHASHTYIQKYGMFDFRGGGRASGRETAARVAAGAIAKQALTERGVTVIGFTRQIADIIAPTEANNVSVEIIESNIVRCPDAETAQTMIRCIHNASADGDSVGGVVEVVIKGCPPGLGEPIYHKLDADLAAALMTIGAVKGFEIGNGFSSVLKRGSENNDPYFQDDFGNFRTVKNDAGGIIGGISNGEDIIVRIAVKPVSSITKPTKTANKQGEMVDFFVRGRHDPCICPRVVPVAEAMVALALMDHLIMQEQRETMSNSAKIQQKINALDRELEILQYLRERYITELQASNSMEKAK